MVKTIVHFGAGNIGRSLVGSLFSAAGYHIVFVDIDRNVIDRLNSQKRYRVCVKDSNYKNAPDIMVENVRGVHSDDITNIVSEIQKASLISTAVGLNVLPKILPTIAQGILSRDKDIAILFCENIHNVASLADKILREHLPIDFRLEDKVGLVPTSIGKMVPIMPDEIRRNDPLEVWGEAYNKIIADQDAWVGEPLEIEGVEFKRDFNAYVDRKLFIHNLGHATAAYYGFICGKSTIADALDINWVRNEVVQVMQESAVGIVAAYSGVFSSEQLQEHIDDLVARFRNTELNDSVFRVGRDLNRKLASGDRFIGAIALCRKNGCSCQAIVRAIATALHFRGVDDAGFPFPPDVSFHKQLTKTNVEQALKQICGLDDKDDILTKTILIEYDKMRSFMRANCSWAV